MRHVAYEFRGKPVPKEQGKALAVAASLSIRERTEAARLCRRVARVDALPVQRRSVERAMLAVEEKIVKALWVLAQGQAETWNYYPSTHGIDYLRERVDHFMAGDWQHVAPRPGLPEGKHIDEATKVQGWLMWLGPTEARVLTVGAMSKRGDAGRRVSWIRVRSRLPELRDMPERTLKHTYTSALRNIVSHLTSERLT